MSSYSASWLQRYIRAKQSETIIGAIAAQRTPALKYVMNIRLEKYKANRISGMNMYNAAKAAGYSHNYAKNAYDKLKKVENGGVRDALEQAGLTSQYQAGEIFKLTQATKVISCNVFIDKDGKMKEADGKTLDFIEVDDPGIRLRTHEFVAKLKNQLNDSPLIDNSKHQHFYNLTVKDLDGKSDKDIVDIILRRAKVGSVKRT